MSKESNQEFQNKVTLGGMLVATGIVFGDIGTSPLYTQDAIFHGRVITESVALGTLSAIFWTLTFQTTIKYVLLTLQADNNGEGGIFSLYALIRRYWGRWLIIPAIAGASFLMADGIITPPISVTSAMEGIYAIRPDFNIIPVVVVILVLLFIFQQFGTERIGKIYGPVMLIWFTFIGVIGFMALTHNFSVLKALNPWYTFRFLSESRENFWLLGSVFLCSTGAEALYSDMGHCGRNNIRASWLYVKIMLILSYAGQTAWLMQHTGERLTNISPFYATVPHAVYWPALAIATLATIIASQALISGCFTLINEAIRLEIWPRLMVAFPGRIKGQIYIPAINWLLMCGCVGMVLHFKESNKMEAAFGLSVTLTMLTTTFLINFYLYSKRVPLYLIFLVTGTFLTIELTFLMANLQKLREGGWITIVIGTCLSTLMIVWWMGRSIKRRITERVNLNDYVPKLVELSEDTQIQKYCDNLVYLTTANSSRAIEKTITQSILSGIPKRADVYWFLHVNITDEPFTLEYACETLDKNEVYFLTFNMGFRIEPRIDYYFRQVLIDLEKSKDFELPACPEMKYQNSRIGDVRFVLMSSFLSYDNELPFVQNLIMKLYFLIKRLSVTEDLNFGLDRSHVVAENYPLIIHSLESPNLVRIGGLGGKGQ
jgi:KUP system potassium uptake protein